MPGHLALLVLPLLLLTGLAPTRAHAATGPINAFYLESSPTSLIGQGQTYDLTDDNATFSSNRYRDAVYYGMAVEIRAGDFIFAVVGPNYSTPVPGTYENVRLWPTQATSPGMLLTAFGRENLVIAGSFTVLELTLSPVDTVESFAADFVQYDHRLPTQWNRGSIRFNSTIPIPEPTSAALLAGMGAMGMMRRPGR